MDWQFAPEAAAEPAAECKAIRRESKQVGVRFQEGGAQPQGSRVSVAVLSPTFRPKLRLATPSSRQARNQEERPLGIRLKCEEVREGCAHTGPHAEGIIPSEEPSCDKRTPASSSNAGSSRANSLCGSLKQPYNKVTLKASQKLFSGSIPKSLKLLLFVEIFSGKSHLSKAFARQGFAVLSWDIAYGPDFDLSIRKTNKLWFALFVPPIMSI